MKQTGLFGDDYEPGKWSSEELAELTGVPKTTKLPKTERQECLFDIGSKRDLPGQTLLFEQNSNLKHDPASLRKIKRAARETLNRRDLIFDWEKGHWFGLCYETGETWKVVEVGDRIEFHPNQKD
jgi:hypothetical protein